MEERSSELCRRPRPSHSSASKLKLVGSSSDPHPHHSLLACAPPEPPHPLACCRRQQIPRSRPRPHLSLLQFFLGGDSLSSAGLNPRSSISDADLPRATQGVAAEADLLLRVGKQRRQGVASNRSKQWLKGLAVVDKQRWGAATRISMQRQQRRLLVPAGFFALSNQSNELKFALPIPPQSLAIRR